MRLLLHMLDLEVEWLWTKVALTNVSQVISDNWVITDDVVWFLSKAELTVDIFVLRR